MTHSHDHSSHSHVHTTNNIKVAFFLNCVFTIAEIVGGIWTNSVAILSDAVHDAGDSFTLGLSWYLEKKSTRGRDITYSYGYRRFSLLGAVISGVVLLSGSLLVLSEAIPRLIHPEPSHAQGMLAFALFGILINSIAVFRLRGETSINARIVALHLLEDVLGWAGVLVVAIVLFFKPIYILDPLLSILITAYVLYKSVANLRKTLLIFLQAAPLGIDISDVESQLAHLSGVVSVHHTHSWSLDGTHHVLTTHVVVPTDTKWEDISRIKKEAKQLLRSLHFHHATIEIEVEDEECTAS